jgi:hypothetical protein
MKLALLALLVLSSSLRADDVATAIKHFYVELDAVSIRGTLDDILSGSDKPSPTSIRTNFEIEIAPKKPNKP